MSSSIIASIQSPKTRLASLKEISLEFESPHPNSSLDQLGILYTTRKQVLADKFDRIQLCVRELEDAYYTWLRYIQTITATKKREEEEKAYECIIESEDELFRRMHERKETLIMLTRYMDDTEQSWRSYTKERKLYQAVAPENYEVIRQLLSDKYGDPRE
ncbi:hypothetical protein DINM_000275 [Dirofilaria immitis]|nr:hypothetical protein [Dirofilaria immitis]